VQAKVKNNHVAQQGWWKEKEREIMWHSRVSRGKSTEQQSGTAGSDEREENFEF
jgi:hypothetical protein